MPGSSRGQGEWIERNAEMSRPLALHRVPLRRCPRHRREVRPARCRTTRRAAKLALVLLHADPREGAEVGQRMLDRGALDVAFVDVRRSQPSSRGTMRVTSLMARIQEPMKSVWVSGERILHRGADAAAAAMAHHHDVPHAQRHAPRTRARPRSHGGRRPAYRAARGWRRCGPRTSRPAPHRRSSRVRRASRSRR